MSSDPLKIAKLALPLMTQHGIEPTPKNYAVWYAYVESRNRDLVKEVDGIINDGRPFNNNVNSYLYTKYVGEKSDQKLISDTTQGAQLLLAEVLEVIHQFSGHTDGYNKEVDQHVQKLASKVGDSHMGEIIKEIIASAASLKDSGTSLNRKLDESKQEIQALKQNLEKITREAQRDFLTGVYNRKAFDNFLEERIKAVNEEGGDLCLLMIDIDYFKRFNDKFGHLIGDEVLKIVAKELVNSVKGKDFVARYGGEEFAVILPATPLAGAMYVAENLRQTIASHDLRRKDTGEICGSITISVGVAAFKASQDTISSLIRRADEALYKSKHEGRNRVTQEAA